MERGRYMLIYNDWYVSRFKSHTLARNYAKSWCNSKGDHYVIVDTQQDCVIFEWKN